MILIIYAFLTYLYLTRRTANLQDIGFLGLLLGAVGTIFVMIYEGFFWTFSITIPAEFGWLIVPTWRQALLTAAVGAMLVITNIILDVFKAPVIQPVRQIEVKKGHPVYPRIRCRPPIQKN
ncbi:MAG: hypothetical protein QXT27_01640 [Pyrobaculum sp.]